MAAGRQGPNPQAHFPALHQEQHPHGHERWFCLSRGWSRDVSCHCVGGSAEAADRKMIVCSVIQGGCRAGELAFVHVEDMRWDPHFKVVQAKSPMVKVHGWHRPTLVLVSSMGRMYGHEQACAICGRVGRGREPNPDSSLPQPLSTVCTRLRDEDNSHSARRVHG